MNIYKYKSTHLLSTTLTVLKYCEYYTTSFFIRNHDKEQIVQDQERTPSLRKYSRYDAI